MIFLYFILFVLAVLLVLYVFGVIADKERENEILRANATASAKAMKNCMDWIDEVAAMEPLTALKEVQKYSADRNAQ